MASFVDKDGIKDFLKTLLTEDKNIKELIKGEINRIDTEGACATAIEALLTENSHVSGNAGSVIKRYDSKRCYVFIPLENKHIKFYWEGLEGSTNISKSSTKILVTNGTDIGSSIALLNIVESAIPTNGFISEYSDEEHYAVLDCNKILSNLSSATHIAVVFDMEGEKKVYGYNLVKDIPLGEIKARFIDIVNPSNPRINKFKNAGDIAYTSNAGDVYVSTDGNDSNTGNLNSPVKSIQRAIEVANTIDSDVVNININPGDYRLSNISIDSDKQLKFFGNNTNIKGSINLGSPIEVSEGILKWSIDTTGFIYQLFINGERRLSASTTRETKGKSSMCKLPEGVTMSGEGKYRLFSIPLSSNDFSILSSQKDDVLVTVFRQWRSYKARIYSVDSTNNSISLYLPTGGNANITTGDYFVIENIKGAIDINNRNECFTEGTFYQDVTGGFLYYKLKQGESIDNIIAEVPVCEHIDVNCEATFSNIKFCQYGGDFIVNTNKKCYEDGQGGYTIDGTFRIKSRNVNFTKCLFYGFTNHCIKYYNTSSDSIVEKCKFTHCGCGSVYIGDSDKTAETVPSSVIVHNNVIQYTGELLQQSCGVIVSLAKECEVSNNEISYTNYSGITGGLVWDSSKTPYSNCKFNYNSIRNINHNSILSDMGGIYSVGRSDNTEVVGNRIHDINGDRLCSGVYLDECSCGVVVCGNIIYNTSGSSFFAHRSRNNDVYNNIFAFSTSEPVYYQARTGDYGSDRCYNNIVYGNSDTVFNVRHSVINCEINSNLYYSSNGTGNVEVDKNAVYLNPNFKNPEEFDFSIEDTSNVDNIEFEAFENKSGVIGSYMKSLID